ncbi:heme peroxidase, partial [Gautieria morchelliformis]
SHSACCPCFVLRDDLQNNAFSHQCGENTHEAARLSFRRSIPRQRYRELPAGGGADRSMLILPNIELNFHADLRISDSLELLTPFLHNHTQVSAGDLIQFATASHFIARSDHVDPSIKAVPFDSMPFTFDTQVFLEVLLNGTGFPGTPNNTSKALTPLPWGSGVNAGEMCLQSDFLIARDPHTACTWQGFVNEQETISNAFKDVIAKLAVIGQNSYKLIDCSEVILDPMPASGKPAMYVFLLVTPFSHLIIYVASPPPRHRLTLKWRLCNSLPAPQH